MIKKASHVIMMLLVSLILFANVYGFVQRQTGQTAFPMILGFGTAIVVSGSMAPDVQVNDIVLVHQVPEATYKKGDIITYRTANHPVTHRIIQRHGDQVVTQGDANNGADTAIQTQDIYGKVVLTLPKVGGLLRWLQQPLGLVVLAAGLIAVWESDRWLTWSKHVKSKKSR